MRFLALNDNCVVNVNILLLNNFDCDVSQTIFLFHFRESVVLISVSQREMICSHYGCFSFYFRCLH